MSRKPKNLFIAAAVMIPLGITFYDALRPAPKVQLGRETTYIAEPVAEDGLPNYALAIIESQRKGVTLDNNGARDFWRAMGPANLSADHFAFLCRELQIVEASLPRLAEISGDATVERLSQWISTEQNQSAEVTADEARQTITPEDAADALLKDLVSRPWTIDQSPPLKKWLTENKQSLDLLVQAASASHFFSPPPDVLEDPHTPVVEMMLPHADLARGAVRSLAARAMNRVARRQYEAAWGDIRACWQLGAHIGRGPSTVEKLVGIAIRHVAKDATLALLQADDLPEGLAATVVQDVRVQPDRFDVVQSFDLHGRLLLLDCALRQVTGRLGGLGDDEELSQFQRSVDPNVILRMCNQWHDRLIEILRIEDPKKSNEVSMQFELDLNNLESGITLKSRRLLAMVSRSKRSEIIGEILITNMLPATGVVIGAADRDRTSLELVRAAAALAHFRSQHGDYPAAIAELPEDDHGPWHDPYSGEPFKYERREGGFLLYSVFENGVDDGATDYFGKIVGGEWTDSSEEEADIYAADLVIRLPLPPLQEAFAAPAP